MRFQWDVCFNTLLHFILDLRGEVNKVLLSVRGRLAQLARAAGLHPVGHRFESCAAHHFEGFLDIMGESVLKGKRLAIARGLEDDAELQDKLKALGADVLELPLGEITTYGDGEEVEDCFAELNNYSWVIFTDKLAVETFFGIFFKRFRDIRCVGGLRIACFDDSVAKMVRKYFLDVDVISSSKELEDLANLVSQYETIENEKILVVTGLVHGKKLSNHLQSVGMAIVDTLPVSAKVEEPKSRELDVDAIDRFKREGADAIIFNNPTVVKLFIQQARTFILDTGATHPITISANAETSSAMREHGMPVKAEAKKKGIKGIVESLERELS